MGTDQNFDFMKINNNNNISDILDVFYTLGVIPTITCPTRITHTSATLNDNIYIRSDKLDSMQSIIITTDISDHLPISMCMGTRTIERKQKPLIFEHRKINDEIIHKMSSSLITINRNNVLNVDNVNEAYETFITKFTEILDKHAPIKVVKISHKSIIREAWVTNGIITSSKTRDKLYKKSLWKSKTDTDYEKFIA